MRITTLTLAAAGLACAAFATPAAAYDYPYCLQGRSMGIPGDCSYTSYAQCMASASGRLATCNINPRVAFAREGRGRRAARGNPQQPYGYNDGYWPQQRW